MFPARISSYVRGELANDAAETYLVRYIDGTGGRAGSTWGSREGPAPGVWPETGRASMHSIAAVDLQFTMCMLIGEIGQNARNSDVGLSGGFVCSRARFTEGRGLHMHALVNPVAGIDHNFVTRFQTGGHLNHGAVIAS